MSRLAVKTVIPHNAAQETRPASRANRAKFPPAARFAQKAGASSSGSDLRPRATRMPSSRFGEAKQVLCYRALREEPSRIEIDVACGRVRRKARDHHLGLRVDADRLTVNARALNASAHIMQDQTICYRELTDIEPCSDPTASACATLVSMCQRNLSSEEV
jgi:hypothetical protein